MEGEHHKEQCNSSLQGRDSVSTLSDQLLEAKTTIAVLTQQLQTGQLTQEKLERELNEARSSSLQFQMDLTVAQERLKAADESQKRLEKQLIDAQTRVAKEIPQLETELAVAKEQLKALGDKLAATKQQHSLQLENIELQLQSMEEKFEVQFQTAEDLLAKTNRQAADLPVPVEELYLASMMLTTDLSQELICVIFEELDELSNEQEVMIQRFKTMRAKFVRPGGIFADQMFTGSMVAHAVTVDDTSTAPREAPDQEASAIDGSSVEDSESIDEYIARMEQFVSGTRFAYALTGSHLNPRTQQLPHVTKRWHGTGALEILQQEEVRGLGKLSMDVKHEATIYHAKLRKNSNSDAPLRYVGFDMNAADCECLHFECDGGLAVIYVV
eukprot:jgi/Phyca11/535086/estExt2_fgenesh1_pg.C_PHYCAscaffold_310083